ncbi:outer membrane lipoprotein-sorting protein [uncultured Kordia sp.]|uniref:outer membrane lipoprotein-sorting protein n=1 Tax=uncultured Kordia sp. TaxID=507699 RepID=UPI002624916E|nr:outer membrane lipoprotein-sorting protein [uncultured Kordia sp.]
MKTIISVLVFILTINSSSIFAQQTLMDGQLIAKKTHERNEGISLKRNLIMELKDKRGKIRTRKTTALRKYFGKEKRLAIFYETPSSVKGTAFLTFDYPEASKDDDQWLYLPALRKTRRISAANRGDYFLGTDLTYEDIKLETKISKEDYNYTTIGIEKIDNHDCYIIEAIPKNDATKKELGYSKVKFWVDSKLWMMRKSESWDVAGNFLKTVKISDIKKVQNIWTISHILVINHKTKHETIFKFENNDYQTELSDDYFTEEALVNGL